MVSSHQSLPEMEHDGRERERERELKRKRERREEVLNGVREGVIWDVCYQSLKLRHFPGMYNCFNCLRVIKGF